MYCKMYQTNSFREKLNLRDYSSVVIVKLLTIISMIEWLLNSIGFLFPLCSTIKVFEYNSFIEFRTLLHTNDHSTTVDCLQCYYMTVQCTQYYCMTVLLNDCTTVWLYKVLLYDCTQYYYMTVQSSTVWLYTVLLYV